MSERLTDPATGIAIRFIQSFDVRPWTGADDEALARVLWAMKAPEDVMTDDEQTPTERAALGAVLAACPRCGSFDPRETNRGRWACAGCGLRFAEPVYFQRVPPSAPDPAA